MVANMDDEKTVRCPCGREMKLVDVANELWCPTYNDPDSGGVPAWRYRCLCGWISPSAETPEAAYAAAMKREEPHSVKCEKCGADIDHLLVNMFNHEGCDSFRSKPFVVHPEGAVSITTSPNWTGYELSDEERLETIVCPHCRQYPFVSCEIDVHEPVELVMFPMLDQKRPAVPAKEAYNE